MEAEQARLRFNAVTTRKRPGIYPPVFQKYFPPTIMIALPMALVCFSIAMIKKKLDGERVYSASRFQFTMGKTPWERKAGA